ncbi:chemotaxis protein CheW [Microvirga pudoricolor]|uniref:chemotaxis protein CheW n=1 Tax=Microvirga pudoricolor TaxID=2778729 RepID=UPI001951CA61|nr:chemotaxis protein CheW [Microvirga pudoricolor]MBM6594804.1 chemotaxis protein CheW [Microvirga pudoricolor]
MQILLFEVGGVGCALRRQEVRELLPMPHLWRPPALPRSVAGFFNLGGQAVPVVTLATLFGLEAPGLTKEAEAYRHLMLIDRLGGSGPAAFLVDRVIDLVTVDEARLSPVPASDTLNGCIEAEIEHSGALVHLLSLERILLAEERQSLADLSGRAQERLGEWATDA